MQKILLSAFALFFVITSCSNGSTSNVVITDSAAMAVTKEYLSDPLTPHIYTADPSAHVFNNRVYVYPSHDTATGKSENDKGDHFDMVDYHIFSMDSVGGEVMDHGIALHLKDIPWAGRQLWAPDAAFSNNQYYLYFPAKDKEDIFRIGVATSKNPEGPFVADRQPIKGSYSNDPCIFKDDDGKFYLYFGGIGGGQLQFWNRNTYDPEARQRQPSETAALPRMARLNAGMTSFSEDAKEIEIVDNEGNLFTGEQNDKRFFEAAWVHKRRGTYYFSYATGDTHLINYATGDNPYGPFTYRGTILQPVEGWTSQHSIVEEKGKWWLFYHDSQLSGKTHLRNVKVTELIHNDDGSIQTITPVK